MSGFQPVARKQKRKTKVKYENLTPEEIAQNYIHVVRKYKTEKCKKGWLSHNFNSCPNGRFCFDAHSEGDIRRDPLKGDVSVPLYDRALCQQYLRSQTCSNGKNCKQAHNETEVMYHPRMYKSKPCNKADDCERENLCAFIHRGDQLRPQLRAALFFGGPRDEGAGAAAAPHAPVAPTPVGSSPVALQQQPAKPMAGFEPLDPASIVAETNGFADPYAAAAKSKTFDNKSTNGAAVVVPSDFAGLQLGGANADAFLREQQQQYLQLQREQEERAMLLKQQQEEERRAQEEFDRRRLQMESAAVNRPVSAPTQPPPGMIATAQHHHTSNNNMASGSTSPKVDSVAETGQPSATLHKSVLKVLTMLAPGGTTPPLSEELAFALLDVLAACPEGRTGFDAAGNSGLLHAVSRCAHGVARRLANPVTVDAENNCSQSPLTIAIDGDDAEMLEILMDANVNLNVGRGALLDAIDAEAFECAAVLARNAGDRVDVTLRDDAGEIAITAAAAAGLESIVRELCASKKELIAARNARGETALMVAAKGGRIGIVILLVQLGADVNAVDNEGRTPLMHALAESGSDATAEVLLQLCPDGKLHVAAQDYAGATALSLAEARGYGAIAASLRARGAHGPASSNATGFGW